MKNQKIIRTRKKIRSIIIGTSSRPRLSVYRSTNNMYAQLIDDQKGNTLVAVASVSVKEKMTKTSLAGKLGELIAKKALAKKIKKVVFDRGGWRYLGRIKSFAEGARKGGLEF